MASAIPSGFTSLTLSAGIQTAFTAPSGTALVVNYWSLARNITGVTTISAKVWAGPTASPSVIFPPSGLKGPRFVSMGGALILNAASNAIIISASSGSGLDFIACGLAYV